MDQTYLPPSTYLPPGPLMERSQTAAFSRKPRGGPVLTNSFEAEAAAGSISFIGESWGG